MSARDSARSMTRNLWSSESLNRFREPWEQLRDRLLWGIPWGTFVISSVLVFVYLSVQHGAARWSEPLVIPFTSWSYSHPLGVLFGPVSHVGPEHLLDNLVGVLVFGSMAEYVYGHKRTDDSRTDDERTDDSRIYNHPRVRAVFSHAHVRAVVLFPTAAMVAGVLASVFSWGPTIGFSHVVFAFAGFALVRYPLGTVLVVSVREALVVVSQALEQPLEVATTTSASEPWFVDIAIQGHLFGLLLGITVGVLTLSLRDETLPSPVRLWAALVVFGLVQSLWLVWWPRETTYVLARGLGVVVVLCLATLVAGGYVLAVGNIPHSSDRLDQHVGLVLLLVPLSIMAGIAIPINATGDVTAPAGTETVDVHGYEVTYVEDITNQRLAPFGSVTDTEPPTTNGVLVVHPDRGVWTQAVDGSDLEADGTATVRLGGLGWERTVFAIHRVWRTAGGNATSQVWIHPRDGGFHRVYRSEPARATAVVEGYNLSIVPEGIRFRLEVSRDNETLETATIPNRGQTVTVRDLEIHREGDRLVAVINRTRVPIAWRG